MIPHQHNFSVGGTPRPTGWEWRRLIATPFAALRDVPPYFDRSRNFRFRRVQPMRRFEFAVGGVFRQRFKAIGL